MTNQECNSDLFIMLCDAAKLLSDIGYNHIEINSITVNNRLSSTLGNYNHDTKSIEINKKHYLLSPRKDVMNTIIHEISHNIHHLKYGISPEHNYNDGHTDEWRQIAEDIGSKTEYKISQYGCTTYNLSKVDIQQHYIHYIKCKTCGYTLCGESKFESPDRIINKAKCICCKCNGEVSSGFECYETRMTKKKVMV